MSVYKTIGPLVYHTEDILIILIFADDSAISIFIYLCIAIVI